MAPLTSPAYEPVRLRSAIPGPDTPGRYVSRLRTDRAAQLLRDTDDPILHIALEVGYASEQALSKAFVRQYATAPGRYRRQHRGT